MKYKVDTIGANIAKELIVKNHHINTQFTCKHAFGLFSNDKIVGVIVYGSPVGRLTSQSISDVLENHEVLELKRLWVINGISAKTKDFFINSTFNWLKKNTEVKVLITYTENSEISLKNLLKRCKWFYQGNDIRLVKSYTHKIFGELYHPRTACLKFGTTNPYVLKTIDPNYSRIEIPKKDRFIYVLKNKDKVAILSTLKHPIV